MDRFELKNIEPMLIENINHQAFNSPDCLYELKLDGIRAIAYLSNEGTELRNKRNDCINRVYPELLNIHKQVKDKCILDGEILILKDGIPDFFELQRRSRMSNTFKITLAAKKFPVCFTAFDILYYEDKDLTGLPLLERKNILGKIIIESSKFSVSRYIKKDGIALYNAAKEMGLEGIVAKKIGSKYHFGKRTKNWFKCKALLDDDFIICGYEVREKSTNIILGAYQNNELIYQSNVTFGVSEEDIKSITSQPIIPKESYYSKFPHTDNVYWIEPYLVCTVKYMERTPHGSLRQPVFKGLRNDKEPKDCVIAS